MNRFLVAVIVTTMVAFNSVAFAAELGTPVDAEAGVVPATEVDAADTVVESTIDTEVYSG